jgi:hypothetical protein
VILLLRAIARLVTFALLALLALAGLTVAVCSIASEGAFSLPWLADQLSLPELRDEVGGLLATLEEPGPVALRSAAAGMGAIAVGVLLLTGVLWPRRQRLAVLEQAGEGTLAGTRRAVGRAAASLVEGVPGLSVRRVRLRPHRRGSGGRLELKATRPEALPREEAGRRAGKALQPLAESFRLRTRVRTRPGPRVI